MSRRFLLCILLWVSPFVVYGSAIFAEYGFRDDYSITREAHEEPGKTLAFTASHGRILYGALLECSFRLMHTIDDLVWLRLVSALLITGFAFLFFRQLEQHGWETPDAAAAALVVAFLPAAQVTISWAVGWPWGIALIGTVCGFHVCMRAWTKNGAARYGRVLVAILLYMASTSIYQSDTLVAVVLLATVLLAPRYEAPVRQTLSLVVFHLAIVLTALLLSYGLLQIIFGLGIFQASGRLQFETQVFSKVIWFLTQSLPNAIAFLTLRDDFGTGAPVFWCLVALASAVMLFALYRQAAKKRLFIWLPCVLLFPWVAHGISLVAAERALGYRTTFALSGLMAVLLLASLREIVARRFYPGILALLVMVSAWQAYWQSYHLIAEPQGREWRMVKDTVAHVPVGVPATVYLIEPNPDYRSTDRVFRDEYGSFTSNSAWAPNEMFKAAVLQRFAGKIPADWQCTFFHGGEVPGPDHHYDHVIDMRTLAHWRHA